MTTMLGVLKAEGRTMNCNVDLTSSGLSLAKFGAGDARRSGTALLRVTNAWSDVGDICVEFEKGTNALVSGVGTLAEGQLALIRLGHDSSVGLDDPRLTLSQRQLALACGSLHFYAGAPSFAALEVRLLANQAHGRLGEIRGASELEDKFDAWSTHLAFSFGPRTVATARIVHNHGVRERSELDAEVSGLPPKVWERTFVELSRVAVLPGCGGGAIFRSLMKAALQYASATGVPNVLLDSIPRLAPKYTALGAVPLGLFKKHQWSDEIEEVLSFDTGNAELVCGLQANV